MSGINWGDDDDPPVVATPKPKSSPESAVTEAVPLPEQPWRPPAALSPVPALPIAEEVEDPSTEFASYDQPVATEEFDKDDEPFDRPGSEKMGIIGGKGVGKSYLFQAMVYRTFSGQHSGALNWFLDRESMRLFVSSGDGDKLLNTGRAKTINRATFIKNYQSWLRLAQTTRASQHWFRLRLPFRTGLLGAKRSAMDVEFLDGSGEGLFEVQALSKEDRQVWEKAYLPAKVMVFCLPLWAAFPINGLSDHDWAVREQLLSGFEQVVQHYKDMRERNHQEQPVSTILALTMADDRRSALRTLYDRWIAPYLDSPHTHLKQLRTGRGISRYLTNARTISEALHDEFAAARDHRAGAIPQNLEIGGGKPWIVPLSAIDGSRLDYLESTYRNPDDPARMREARQAAPTPIHVELPLLVALCERENALM